MSLKVWVNGEKLLASDLNANFTTMGGFLKFGGSGSDGALTVSSGTTQIDLGGARYFEKNYSSISITGTGKVEFINPHAEGCVIVIRCTGDATLTSSSAPMLSAEGCGSAGGGGGVRSTTGGGSAGDNATDGKTYGFIQTKAGLGGTSAGAGVSGGAVGTFGFMGGVNELKQIVAKAPKLFVGAGGGGGYAQYSSGGSGTITGGTGGKGGGCLILEIKGAINFTTANGISVAGANGGNGSKTGTPTNYAGGGGGGGGGGSCYIFYTTATAFTGTVKVSGGTGGNTVGAVDSSGGGGGGGSALNTGNASSSASNGNKSGGDGGAGLEVHNINNDFA